MNSINILINEPECSKYLFASITEAFKCVVKMKQEYNTSILDYSRCLKQAKEILETHVGKDILVHYVDNLEEFKNSTEAE